MFGSVVSVFLRIPTWLVTTTAENQHGSRRFFRAKLSWRQVNKDLTYKRQHGLESHGVVLLFFNIIIYTTTNPNRILSTARRRTKRPVPFPPWSRKHRLLLATMLSSTVLVVGSGPVGLWLALELRRASLDALVIDTRASRDDRDPHSKALTMSAGSLATFDQRGMAQLFLSEGFPMEKAHFGGLETLLNLNERVLGLRHSYNLVIPQARTEAILLRQCEEAGVRFAWGHKFLRLEQTADYVTATAAKVGAGEIEETTIQIKADWLVGCDGTHSAVRAAAGIPFEGIPGTVTGVLADVMLESPSPPRGDGWGISRTAQGTSMVVRADKTYFRFVGLLKDARDIPTSQPPTIEEIRGHLRNAYGSDLGAHSPGWLSRFGSACRLASSFRAGRVFVAGDAAHQFLPAGGQGMNLGLQDASNLAWKLAMAARGGPTTERLLDSYSKERVPADKEVIDNVLAQMALFLAEKPHENALRDLARESFRVPEINELWALRVTGFGEPREPYRSGEAGRGDDDPLVGSRLSHLKVGIEGDELSLAMAPDRFVLLLRTDRESYDADLRAEAARWKDRVTVLEATTCSKDSRWDGACAILVRPDGRVAWVGREAALLKNGGLAGPFASVLEWWFGDRPTSS